MDVPTLQWLYDHILHWLVHEHLPGGMPLCSFERISSVIRPCDVVLVEGVSRTSEVIKWITQSPWSHAALSIGSMERIRDPEMRTTVNAFYTGDPKEPLIIEALMDKGVVVTPLRNYKKHHLRICRPKGLSEVDAHKVMHLASLHLECDYDFRHILDLARFLFPYRIFPRHWGSTLFQRYVGYSTRTVCSSMLARAFMSVHFPIIPIVQRDEQGILRIFKRNFRLFTPRDFDVSPYFEIIKYPLLGYDDLADYHNLPWALDNMMCNTEGDCYAVEGQPTTQPLPVMAASQRTTGKRMGRIFRRLFEWSSSLPFWNMGNVKPAIDPKKVLAEEPHRHSRQGGIP